MVELKTLTDAEIVALGKLNRRIAIAQTIGYTDIQVTADGKIIGDYEDSPDDWRVSGISPSFGGRVTLPDWERDIEHAFELGAEAQRMGIAEMFVMHLEHIAIKSVQPGVGFPEEKMSLAHATARQRCFAFLMAVRDKGASQ